MSSIQSYATVAQLRARNEVPSTALTNDGRMMEKLREATQNIIRYCGGREFSPTVAARTFDWESSLELLFRGFDLLTLTSVSDVQSAKTITSSTPQSPNMLGNQFSDPTTYGPWYGMELDPTRDFFLYSTTKTKAITVTGIWGWHDDYSAAWASVYTDNTFATTLQLSGSLLSSTAGTPQAVTTNADPTVSYSSWYQTPAISAGSLIKIDSEYLAVINTISGQSKVIVMRGVNGTTAAAHSSGAAITVYEPPKDINGACLTWAAYLLAKDSTDFEKTLITPLGGQMVPQRLPNEFYTKLDPYVRSRIG